MKRISLVLILVCCLQFLDACGGASGVPQPVTTHFSITAQPNAVAGTALKITVTALDASNNTVTTYSGTVHFTSSDAQAVLPAASTLASGTGTFSVTLMTPGPQTITATDTASITGTSSSITVTAPATHFAVTGPSNATTGISFSFTVTALDASNNTVTTYSGTVHFTSTDVQATLPANLALTSGTGTFPVTLKTLGSQTITATDTAVASITGTSSSIAVGTAAPTHFSVAPPGGARPGSAFTFTVNALDAASNVATAYSGTIHFTSTDPLASLPANSTLTNGTGSFSATLNTLGYQTITATDTVTPSITGTSNAVDVYKVTITSGNPPNGRVGAAYGPLNDCLPQGFILSASGGVFPGYYSWTSTSLPPGLKIGSFIPSPAGPDCRPGERAVWMIYGIPTQAGAFNNVVITVNSGSTILASATYTITINATPAAAATRSADSPSTLDSTTAHHHYKLIDLGTLGGPNGIVNEVFYEIDGGTAGARAISDQGIVVGQADTSTPDPLCFFELDSSCLYSNAFQWQNGTLTDLGALPGAQWSSPNWISGNGLIAGISETGQNDPLTTLPEGHGVVWRNGAITDVGTLQGGYESFSRSRIMPSLSASMLTESSGEISVMIRSAFFTSRSAFFAAFAETSACASISPSLSFSTPPSSELSI